MSADNVYDFVPAEPDTNDTPYVPDGALICEQCGNPFEHSGRGRKPKRCPDCRATKSTGTRSKSPSGDVKTAMAVLEGMYDSLSLALMMFSPRGALTWSESRVKLEQTAQLSLQGDPALAKQICRIGTVSGRGMFYGAHVMALIPVAMVVREDLAERRAAKRAANPEPDEEYEQYPEAGPRPAYPNQEMFE